VLHDAAEHLKFNKEKGPLRAAERDGEWDAGELVEIAIKNAHVTL
jgi:hypothetical protein